MVSQTQFAQPVAVARGDGPDPSVAEFAGPGSAYYAERFPSIAGKGLLGTTFNRAAAFGGPVWAAGRGLWTVYWPVAVAEAIALILVARGLWGTESEDGTRSFDGGPIAMGLIVVLVARLAQGLLGSWAYYQRFRRWRIYRQERTGFSLASAVAGGALVAIGYGLLVYRFSWPEVAPSIAAFPTDKAIFIGAATAIDQAKDWLISNLAAFFDAVTAIVRTILLWLELLFVGTPWPLATAILLIIAWRVGGRRVAIFTAAALAYIGLFGFWAESMATLALVGAATLICVVLGTPAGIWCAKSRRVDAVVRPILDVMQTMPSFVYLVPAIAFFGIGKVPGVIATVVFSLPPMVRLTALGIRQVPQHVTEAAVAFGASPRQLLYKIELPLAIPSVMAGINQTIMMCLSMVVIAALIGAGGLGDFIVRGLRHLETGKSLLAGIAIVLCAMILDRIVQASTVTRRR
jgi:glycine betaine/proline transport system permease protein